VTRPMVELAVERACADHAEPTASDMLLEALVAAERSAWRPQHVFMSPWWYDVARLVIEEGKTPYLAMKRADLNERRAREARPPADPGAFAGVARSVWS
jgi:hypothetical protein